MKQVFSFIFVVFLTGCSVVGEKEVFLADSSNWKMTKLFSQNSYLFECNEIRISLDEIVLATKTTSYGPLLPIIPSGKKTDNTDKNLKLKLTVVGKVNSSNFTKKDFSLVVKESEIELIKNPAQHFNVITDKPYEDGVWIQYGLTYEYSKKLKDIQELSIKVKVPFAACSPDELKLTRQTVDNSEFIIAPGA